MTINSFCRALLVLALLAPGASAFAGAAENLREWFQSTQSLEAAFEQTVIDEAGRTLQKVNGTLYLLRPNRFRWDYQSNKGQLIVADGVDVWVFDRELMQVTVQAINSGLQETPALLLGSNRSLDERFNLREEAGKDGLEWVTLEPKKDGSGFERVRLGTKANELRIMELFDAFGQTTRLVFSRFKPNLELDEALFEFAPPPGADVMRNDK